MEVSGCVIEPVVSPGFEQVAYVVWRAGSDEALAIDPGFDADTLLDVLRARGLKLAAILNTHGHADHIAGNAAIKAAYPEAPLVIGRNEAHLLDDPEANLSAPFGLPLTSPAADRLVADGERVEWAGLPLEIREVPGHSPGSVVFVYEGGRPALVFGGDVLFAGSVGRTDLGGNGPQLAAGIRTKLFTLPDDTIVFPGHGPPTTVGAERRSNPFVGEGAGPYRLG